MKETIAYCGKDKNNRYVHFYNNEFLVKFCGHKETYKIKIKECNNKENTHWSWWNNEKQEFQFTHYMKDGVIMCFPYGIKIMEQEGEGILLPVIVELIE